MGSSLAGISIVMTPRFTIDGSPELESRLESLCRAAGGKLQGLIAGKRLQGVVLGGGYGRGHGGVLRTSEGDQPYNDLEFYVFLRGPRLAGQHRYGPAIQALSDELTGNAGLHVEFKIDSLLRLRSSPVSMFSYDLVTRHRVIHGRDLFHGCEAHLDAPEIPASEATRLLFNRCSGLLLCRERFQYAEWLPEDADFVCRNIAKAGLALGDVVLVMHRGYHWDCRERHQRLIALSEMVEKPWISEVLRLHRLGMEFKLHPYRSSATQSDLFEPYEQVSRLARKLWLWLEEKRLQRPFPTISHYWADARRKCPETSRWRNYLLNLRTFGRGSLLDPMAARYPRERLFNTLPLLLWNGTRFEPAETKHLQQQLRTPAANWGGFVNAYKNIWTIYG
jgi:hypothetical protein